METVGRKEMEGVEVTVAVMMLVTTMTMGLLPR